LLLVTGRYGDPETRFSRKRSGKTWFPIPSRRVLQHQRQIDVIGLDRRKAPRRPFGGADAVAGGDGPIVGGVLGERAGIVGGGGEARLYERRRVTGSKGHVVGQRVPVGVAAPPTERLVCEDIGGLGGGVGVVGLVGGLVGGLFGRGRKGPLGASRGAQAVCGGDGPIVGGACVEPAGCALPISLGFAVVS